MSINLTQATMMWVGVILTSKRFRLTRRMSVKDMSSVIFRLPWKCTCLTLGTRNGLIGKYKLWIHEKWHNVHRCHKINPNVIQNQLLSSYQIIITVVWHDGNVDGSLGRRVLDVNDDKVAVREVRGQDVRRANSTQKRTTVETEARAKFYTHLVALSVRLKHAEVDGAFPRNLKYKKFNILGKTFKYSIPK